MDLQTPEGESIGRQSNRDSIFDSGTGFIKVPNNDVTIIPLDNSKNNGGRKVSIEEALDWDYAVTEELLHKLLNLIDNEYKEGKLNKKQLSAITRGILQIKVLTTQRVQEIATRLESEKVNDGSHDGQGGGSIRLGIDQSEYSKLEESVSIETDENGEPLASNLSFYIGKKARETYSNSPLFLGGVEDITNNNDLQFFKHGSKEIYSFMTPSREIYLDKTVVSAKRHNTLTLSA